MRRKARGKPVKQPFFFFPFLFPLLFVFCFCERYKYTHRTISSEKHEPSRTEKGKDKRGSEKRVKEIAYRNQEKSTIGRRTERDSNG
jgi:hypothetical protein